MANLLLLSNSTLPQQAYLQWPIQYLSDFLSGCSNMVFIPFAGVTMSYDQYTENVNESLKKVGLSVKGIHTFEDPLVGIKEADAILVGGGNTFELLHQLYANDLIDAIQSKVKDGSKYVGWSAGSNIAGTSIKTTNDMPISFPPSFDALNLISFQINPHYTEETLPNHGGESRLQRLKEFLEINQDAQVICIPEGTYLKVSGEQVYYDGMDLEGKILTYQQNVRLLKKGEKI